MNTGFLLFALHLPERRMFNEWYARDISKKRRISNKIKGNAGEPMGQPPYGYMKDPDNPKRWIVDDEAAQVVKHIYGMTLDGMGTEQIAAQLEREEILTPRAYWLKKGVKRPGKGKQQPPTKWNSSTVTKSCPCKSIAAIFSISRLTQSPTRTRSGSKMTVKIG